MHLLASICLLWVLSAAESGSWKDEEAARRYIIEKPSPVEYDAENVEKFLFALMDKLEDMPMPDDPKFQFVLDDNKQMQACEIPAQDDESNNNSANPSDVMATVMRSFADGKCASRVIGDWYYSVCGNLGVKRSPFYYGVFDKKKGRRKVVSFKAAESLGTLARDRTISNHLASVNEPRYLQQTYYEGAGCSLDGDERRISSTVTFECSYRFVTGYVHIVDVQEENPCHFRLQLQSTDFCDSDWLAGKIDSKNLISCRLYFHPERIATLLAFLDKFHEESKARIARYDAWLADPERMERVRQQAARPDAAKMMHKWASDLLRHFDRDDLLYGQQAEKERLSKIIDYVISELTWASFDPAVPFSEQEQEHRRQEQEEGWADDHRRLTNLKNVLEIRREEFMEETPDEDEAFYYEMMGYGELLKIADIEPLRDVHVHFYAAWLDYIKEKSWGGRPMLIPPNRKFPIGSYIMLESLIRSTYADSIRDLFKEIFEEDKEEMKPTTLYDGEELEDSEIEEIAHKFMEVYRAIKNSGDHQELLFDLMDDEDFNY